MMVLPGLIGFASTLVIAAAAIATVCYTFNYINNRYLHEEQGPSRPSSSGNNESSKSWKGYDDWNEISCTICLNAVNGWTTRKLACGHMFHNKCIESWLTHTRCCPNCRTDV
ncbi:RING-H2 finger protein ATL39 [Culex quinquefasciatus]|uniref:RING-H2 finger protein ATL39 n=1 Tax=Culex quinquefasciatus TaxID=7176 RepID=UPI0018E2F140|nr:RING-H2 finger protein ATL39 [Culex quinquefasciatus]